MLELSNEQVGAWVGSFLLPLFRIAGLLMFMPIIGTQLVSTRVRLYLAVAICLAIMPTLPPMPVVDAISVQAVIWIAQEILIGVMLGFVLQLFFQIFAIAGQIVAMQMGLGFASMVDPANGISVAGHRSGIYDPGDAAVPRHERSPGGVRSAHRKLFYLAGRRRVFGGQLLGNCQ